MGRKRQEQHQIVIRNQILAEAQKIVENEGLQGLSIRKITSAIDYSPGIVYHYFKNKDELIDALLFEGYMSIIDGIRQVAPDLENPDDYIKRVMRRFVEIALKQHVMYRLFLLSDSPEILKKTAVLYKGVSLKSESMRLLTEQIQLGMSLGIFEENDSELTAQVVWAGVYGLVMKLITEQNIDQLQQDALVERQLAILMNGIIKR